MNPIVRNWLYLLLVISIAYWLIVGGMKLFPSVNPLLISVIVLVIIYFVTRQQSIVLLF